MPEKTNKKDVWDKVEIILKPLGGFVTAFTVAAVTFLGSKFLERRQAIDSNFRLYAQVMSSREKSDSSLRQEMFNTALAAFLSGKKTDKSKEEKLLQLQLLAYNFHNALDLVPLFEHLYNEFRDKPYFQKRLETLAQDVKAKQIALLEGSGDIANGRYSTMDLNENKMGLTIMAPNLKIKRSGSERTFKVEVLKQNGKKLLIRLQAWITEDIKDADLLFWVGFFDFPTIRNIRLSNGDRCAVVITEYYNTEENREGFESAELSLIYFPGSRASLKEKPFYDEITEQLLGKGGYRSEK